MGASRFGLVLGGTDLAGKPDAALIAPKKRLRTACFSFSSIRSPSEAFRQDHFERCQCVHDRPDVRRVTLDLHRSHSATASCHDQNQAPRASHPIRRTMLKCVVATFCERD